MLQSVSKSFACFFELSSVNIQATTSTVKDRGSVCLCLLLIFQLNVCMGIPGLSNVSTIEATGPWSEILENWVVSDSRSSRASKVMKLGDKALTVSSKISSPNKREVTETDLYLLGAIEKLVYRVDFLENRLRRAEELLYYVISGNMNQKKEPCPSNYTKIGESCYHFSDRDFDWKSSASLCRGLGGHLLEFETNDEKRDVLASLQTNSKLKGKHFWTGGLNPGLLWIWASSAKPVYQNTKQTVPGDGRCLKLAYNSTSKIYAYRSDDCGARHRYACKLTVDDESANKIEKTARMLINRQR
ncbi:C-type lectin domain family 12 member B isoform X1 [Hylaeus anthracinus]|uniref:C-type lectin domain family 12 member B isoform X1 n=1 Tax=Hylaeus anthracinus TaxID=313031 RepID=UPI0023B9B565|nr:C-type lectin domain family 12 member B isoform X1 [Hylaeus anthracinus]